MKKVQTTSSNKWKEVIGCPAEFDSKGIMNIFRNGKVIRIERQRHERMIYMVYSFDRLNVFYTVDGFTIFFTRKKFAKII